MEDIRDERGVPISAGIPLAVRIAFVVGIFLIISVGGMVIGASRYGHVWPADKTTTIPLGPSTDG
jgi:hypothetical protein